MHITVTAIRTMLKPSCAYLLFSSADISVGSFKRCSYNFNAIPELIVNTNCAPSVIAIKLSHSDRYGFKYVNNANHIEQMTIAVEIVPFTVCRK